VGVELGDGGRARRAVLRRFSDFRTLHESLVGVWGGTCKQSLSVSQFSCMALMCPLPPIHGIDALLLRTPFLPALMDVATVVAAKRVPRPPQKNSLQWLNVSPALIEERRLELQVDTSLRPTRRCYSLLCACKLTHS
jgi:hypothetical protein